MLSYYGDDFTGSADVMESLSFNGVATALFLEAPSLKEVIDFRLKNRRISADGKIKAFGVAGISRSLTPAQMDSVLPAIFKKISRIPTQYFHYKICSTFDSSPQVGNVGHAVTLALRYFKASYIPLAVGIPLLNRFCVFGNLFGRANETTYRLDRHPTMAKHPITPMNESDLRVHLSKQTSTPVSLMDVLSLEDANSSAVHYKKLQKRGGYILFDVLENRHLNAIGKLIDTNVTKNLQLLVGSSAIEYALCHQWQNTGRIKKPVQNKLTKPAQRYLIAAGSCSPRTAEQIKHGLSIGYSPVRINCRKLIIDQALEIESCVDACIKILEKNKVPLLFSALGPDDPAIAEARTFYDEANQDQSFGPFLGNAQGKIIKEIIDRTGKLRLSVAGGDTSGYVTKALGIYALEVLIPIAPGAPLCLAHAKNNRYDGLEISLKGGQNGDKYFFDQVAQGNSKSEKQNIKK